MVSKMKKIENIFLFRGEKNFAFWILLPRKSCTAKVVHQFAIMHHSISPGPNLQTFLRCAKAQYSLDARYGNYGGWESIS